MEKVKKKKILLVLAAICLTRKARRRKAQSVWVRCWLERRQRLGMSATLVRELQNEDRTEYRFDGHKLQLLRNPINCTTTEKF